jgi:hypothetical protein
MPPEVVVSASSAITRTRVAVGLMSLTFKPAFAATQRRPLKVAGGLRAASCFGCWGGVMVSHCTFELN